MAWVLVRYGTQALVNQARPHTSHGVADMKLPGVVSTFA